MNTLAATTDPFNPGFWEPTTALAEQLVEAVRARQDAEGLVEVAQRRLAALRAAERTARDKCHAAMTTADVERVVVHGHLVVAVGCRLRTVGVDEHEVVATAGVRVILRAASTQVPFGEHRG